MKLGLDGRVALVLGASGGLGGAIAEGLAAEGVRVALAGRNSAALEKNVEAISANGGRAMSLVWDLAQLDSIDRHVAAVEKQFGPIDILINNTGGPPPTPAAGQPAELWEAQFRAMVLSVIAITDRVAPGMRARKWGRIITSVSSGVVAPIANLGVSNALRSSLVGWSKTLAREVAADGVTVNVVIPGRIATDRIRFLDERRAEREGRTPEEVSTESLRTIPAGRYGDPAEYAAAVTFLASVPAAYITGSMLRIDGGLIPSI